METRNLLFIPFDGRQPSTVCVRLPIPLQSLLLRDGRMLPIPLQLLLLRDGRGLPIPLQSLLLRDGRGLPIPL